MLFRDECEAVVAIPQPGHAWLAGQIVRAWGNGDFVQPSPFEEVCLAAEQHDIAWLAWEAAPTLNPATGRPHQFHEVPAARRVEDWRRGVRLALAAYGRYPALLVSLHADTIYGPLLRPGVLPEEDLAPLRALLDEQHAFQRAVRAALAADPRHADAAEPEVVERNRLLVAVADGLSLAICRGVTDEARHPGAPPRAGMERVGLRLSSRRGDPEDLVLEPWPFGAERVAVVCEGRRLRGRFADEAALRAALEAAERVTVAAVLRPR
jgi:hypothetical protein